VRRGGGRSGGQAGDGADEDVWIEAQDDPAQARRGDSPANEPMTGRPPEHSRECKCSDDVDRREAWRPNAQESRPVRRQSRGKVGLRDEEKVPRWSYDDLKDLEN